MLVNQLQDTSTKYFERQNGPMLQTLKKVKNIQKDRTADFEHDTDQLKKALDLLTSYLEPIETMSTLVLKKI